MRLLAISDTHLWRADGRLSALLEKLSHGADLILHAGDYTSAEVMDFFMSYPFAGVAGNMDPRGVCDRLPVKRVVKANGFKVGLIHGYGSSAGLMERVAVEFEGVDAVVFGHSHAPLIEKKGKVLFLNPGSPFSPRHRGRGTVGILNLAKEISAEILEV